MVFIHEVAPLERKMAHWTNIEEGTYPADEGFLLARSFAATALDGAVIEVYLDRANERRVKGQAMAINALIVQLLEEDGEIDLVLDLGGDFKYLLKAPAIRAGKAFSPGVKSLLQFTAQGPLQKLTHGEYAAISSKLVRLDQPTG
jgi:hypothetical protein